MKLIELTLLTNNLSETIRFYHELLGFSFLTNDKTAVTFATQQTLLHFKLDKTTNNPVYHLAFDIPNNKFDEAFSWLDEKTEIIPLENGSKVADFTRWSAKSFYFYDNNGNVLEFITRYDTNSQSNQPFNASSIINISEIGIVGADVMLKCDELIKKYELEFYAKQPPLNEFAVLGNENGLFIVVKEGRNWYPTTKKADYFYTKLIFENKNIVHQIEFT